MRDPNPQPLTPGQQAILDAIPLREPGPYDLFSRASTSTASTAPATLTLKALEELIDRIGPDPFGEWMRRKGFPPEESLLILPETMRPQLPFWPSYVRFDTAVGGPTLCKDPRSLGAWRAP